MICHELSFRMYLPLDYLAFMVLNTIGKKLLFWFTQSNILTLDPILHKNIGIDIDVLSDCFGVDSEFWKCGGGRSPKVSSTI